jgi:DNA-nicking Smr family endonuclease
LATKADPGSLKDGLRAVRRQRAVAPVAASPTPPRDTAPDPGKADEGALFRQAVVGVQPLPDANRVILEKPPSRRVAAARPPAESLPGRPAPRDDALPARWQDDTRPRRLPDDPEQAAFVLAMSGVEPLPDRNLAALDSPRPQPAPQQSLADRQAVLHESLHAPIALQDRLEGGDEAAYLRPGLAQTVLRDLRRGRWVVQDEIDLHGLNREQARHLIAGFLHTCLHQGKRCLRIVHGKGHGSPHKLSVLRQLVRGWLAQRHEVLAYCQAKPQDGGEGALLVLLRAPRS